MERRADSLCEKWAIFSDWYCAVDHLGCSWAFIIYLLYFVLRRIVYNIGQTYNIHQQRLILSIIRGTRRVTGSGRNTAAVMFSSVKVSSHYTSKRQLRPTWSVGGGAAFSTLDHRRSIKLDVAPAPAPAEAAPRSAASPETLVGLGPALDRFLDLSGADKYLGRTSSSSLLPRVCLWRREIFIVVFYVIAARPWTTRRARRPPTTLLPPVYTKHAMNVQTSESPTVLSISKVFLKLQTSAINSVLDAFTHRSTEAQRL